MRRAYLGRHIGRIRLNALYSEARPIWRGGGCRKCKGGAHAGMATKAGADGSAGMLSDNRTGKPARYAITAA